MTHKNYAFSWLRLSVQKAMEILEDIQRWYAAQCDGDWEHVFGLTISTLDNPGWSVKIDLEDTLLERLPFEPVSVGDGSGSGVWLTCSVEKCCFQGYGDPSQLSRLLGIFLTWAKTVPDWLAIPDLDEAAIQSVKDKEFWALLGEEGGPELCRAEGCLNKRIALSVFCRRHHFETVKKRAYSPET